MFSKSAEEEEEKTKGTDGEHGGGRGGEEMPQFGNEGNRKLVRDGSLQEKPRAMLVFRKEKGWRGRRNEEEAAKLL